MLQLQARNKADVPQISLLKRDFHTGENFKTFYIKGNLPSVIFMYSPPSIAAFVFEHDHLPAAAACFPSPPARAYLLPEHLLLLQGRLGCKALGPAGVQAQRARLEWIYVQNSGALEISSLVHPCPEVAPFQDWHGPSGPLLASAKHLEAPASHSLRACSTRRKRWCGSRVFSLPKEPLTNFLPSHYCSHTRCIM